MMKQLSYSVQKKQKGAVLIVALVILVILTILGVAVMESSVVEERMAGNLLDRNVTFQAAEAGLRAGEAAIAALVAYPTPVSSLSSGSIVNVDTISSGSPTWWDGKNYSWFSSNGGTLASTSLTTVDSQPYYVIEEYEQVCDEVADPTISDCKIVYRVTSIAKGGRNTSVLLQSLYSRRY
ncbi:pilus assembly PilX family protein [Reinekea marinisedimentorum]|uniref:Type IV pilus assembly protein PilX n=1 Tax=Reinekea marinisedimentorum TaxID=230495 RepID=A0A4V2UIJ9_9GAMM|nr:PilX N-terminal domain-containing pilus assembly protein [Reinekea marinisedimentorum]TCS36440.1 type IV pilus assembly protein PilX [Reinekea marinisedimentorum]